MLKYFTVKPVCITGKTSQDNTQVGWVHQVIHIMLVNKDIDKKVFFYITIWGENLTYISWDIRASCLRNLVYKLGQDVIDKDMIFNLD